jgi:hypothetical protein
VFLQSGSGQGSPDVRGAGRNRGAQGADKDLVGEEQSARARKCIPSKVCNAGNPGSAAAGQEVSGANQQWIHNLNVPLAFETERQKRVI